MLTWVQLRFLLFVAVVLPACSSAAPPSENHVALPMKHTSDASPSPTPSTSTNPPAPAVSASSGAAPEPDPPDSPNRDNVVALENGLQAVVELDVDSSSNKPRLALELRRNEKSVLRREGWDDITHFDLKKLHSCDTWSARIVRENLGTRDALRVSLVCRTGEDYMTGSEVAVLVKPDNLETLWAGLGDHLENSMDSCLQSLRISFRIQPPKTLEKTIVEETNWVEQVLDDNVKARLKRECKVGTKRRVERITLP